MRGKYSSAKITDCQFACPSPLSRSCEEAVIINSLNGTSHIFRLDMTNDFTEQIVHPEKFDVFGQSLPTVVPMFAACTRKYQSATQKLISTTDVRMVS